MGEFFGFFMSVVFGIIISCIWGAVVQHIIDNKGYYENWFWWGFFFGFFALLVAVSKPENSYTGNYVSKYSSEATGNKGIENKPTFKDGWYCDRCGKHHADYVGTCSCGFSKYNSDKPNTTAENKATSPSENPSQLPDKNHNYLEELKQLKNLLDSGIITQEDFDKKKTQLLNL